MRSRRIDSIEAATSLSEIGPNGLLAWSWNERIPDLRKEWFTRLLVELLVPRLHISRHLTVLRVHQVGLLLWLEGLEIV